MTYIYDIYICDLYIHEVFYYFIYYSFHALFIFVVFILTDTFFDLPSVFFLIFFVSVINYFYYSISHFNILWFNNIKCQKCTFSKYSKDFYPLIQVCLNKLHKFFASVLSIFIFKGR